MGYIHIGYPKTASTTLQESVFKVCENNICYIGWPQDRDCAESRNIIHRITDLEGYEYGLYRADLKNKLASYSNGRQILLSDESLAVGSSLPGKVCRLSIANRLKNLIPESKVLIVVRNQVDLLKSLFLQQLRGASGCYYKNWDDWLKRQFEFSDLSSWLTVLRFDETYKIYADLFGRENITVLLFEDMLADQLSFFKGVSSFLDGLLDEKEVHRLFMESHANSRVTDVELFLRRISKHILFKNVALGISPWLKNILRDMVLLFGSKVEVKCAENDFVRIKSFYEDSNVALSEYIGRDLAKYGYY